MLLPDFNSSSCDLRRGLARLVAHEGGGQASKYFRYRLSGCVSIGGGGRFVPVKVLPRRFSRPPPTCEVTCTWVRAEKVDSLGHSTPLAEHLQMSYGKVLDTILQYLHRCGAGSLYCIACSKCCSQASCQRDFGPGCLFSGEESRCTRYLSYLSLKSTSSSRLSWSS